jgi:helix-turn-helix domain of resolvase
MTDNRKKFIYKGDLNMKFDISLTTTRSTSQEEADNFIGAMTSRGFSVIQGKINDRYGDKVYIAFTISPMEIPAAANKGGRPRKLTDEQIEEIRHRLSAPGCNKSALAREYGVSYQTIHKLSA